MTPAAMGLIGFLTPFAFLAASHLAWLASEAVAARIACPVPREGR